MPLNHLHFYVQDIPGGLEPFIVTPIGYAVMSLQEACLEQQET